MLEEGELYPESNQSKAVLQHGLSPEKGMGVECFLNLFKMKRVSFLMLILFMLFSCSDDVNDLSLITEYYQNTKNNQDDVGQDHNAALVFAAQRVDIMTASDVDLYNAIQAYFQGEEFVRSTEVPEISVLDDYCPDGCDFKTYLVKAKIDDEETVDLFNELQGILFSKEGEGLDIKDLISQIKEYENRLITENAISEKNLGVLSILRHNLYFWNEARVNVRHPYYAYVKRGPQLKIFHYWYIFAIRVATDVFTYDSCMSEGAGSYYSEEDDAKDICNKDASYASARAFE